MTTMSTLRGVNAGLRAHLGDGPTPPRPPARPPHPLPTVLSRLLDDLIADHPAESHGAIARRFEVATGTRIARMTVQRRRPPRPESTRRVPLTPAQVEALARLLAEHPGATRRGVARLFAAETGRAIDYRTVGARARALARGESSAGAPSGPVARRRRYRSAAEWPAWTDRVSFGLVASPTPTCAARNDP